MDDRMKSPHVIRSRLTSALVLLASVGVAGRASAVVPYKGTLIPLDRWQYRTTAIRDN